MATNAPQDDWHKTGLRLPKELHAQLHEAAAAAGRSYNAEIVARLQETFDRPRGFPAASDIWGQVAILERNRSSLQSRLIDRQRELARLADLIEEARAKKDDAALKELTADRAALRAMVWGMERDIAGMSDELARLFEVASTDAPGTGGRPKTVKIEKAE